MHLSLCFLASVSYQWSEQIATASMPRAHKAKERPAYSSNLPAAIPQLHGNTMDIFTTGKALEREATPKPRSSRSAVTRQRQPGASPLVRLTSTLRRDARSAPKSCPGGSPGGSSASPPLRRRRGEEKRSRSSRPCRRPAALVRRGAGGANPGGGLGGYGRSVNLFRSGRLGGAGATAVGSVDPARPRRTESSAGGHLPCRSGALPAPKGDPSLLCQPLGAGVIRPAGSGLKRARRGGSDAGGDPLPPPLQIAAGAPAPRLRLATQGRAGPSLLRRTRPESLRRSVSRSRPPTSLLPKRLGSSPPAWPSARPVPPAAPSAAPLPLGRRSPGSPEPCPSGGPARCGSGRPGRAGGAEGPRGLRTHRPAAGRRLPLGGTAPGPRHRSSTPFRRRSLAFLRQRRFGLSRAAFLTHGRVNHLQDEGRATSGWKDARQRGGELGGNGTKTNQGRKRKAAAHLRRGGEGSP